jgi:hypothetical protein
MIPASVTIHVLQAPRAALRAFIPQQIEKELEALTELREPPRNHYPPEGIRTKLDNPKQAALDVWNHWKMPTLLAEPAPDQGPVLVTVEYRVDPGQEIAFSRRNSRVPASSTA